MNTVANNIQLCIASQSRKMNSLALNAYSVSALPITSLGQESANPGGGIPSNSSHLYGV